MPTIDQEEQEHERRQQHIQELRGRITRLSGSSDCTYVSPSCPDDITEKFLEHVLAFEEQEQTPLWDALTDSGVTLPAPDELDDAQLGAKLWEVIRAMSLLGHYLHSTDHLSNRELYRYLWTDALREPTTMMPQNPNFACHIDLVSSGSTEDLHLYLKHYADEDTRRQWAADWPDDVIPDHEDPPFDRDRLLPAPPY
jgi:hypothetical protein